MAIEDRRFIKLEGRLILPAGHQHDLVAALRPSKRQSLSEYCLAMPTIAMCCMGHDVFDQTIGLAATGQIRNHGDGAAADELVSHVDPEISVARVAL